MEIIKTVMCQTSDTESAVSIPDFIGMDKPKAFLINQGAHGYAKFVMDELTLDAFEQEGLLSKISSSLERKQIYNIMFDMIKSQRVAASRVLHIILANVEHETAEDIMADNLRFVVPAITGKYLPYELCKEKNEALF